jgi:hypothetical protein
MRNLIQNVYKKRTWASRIVGGAFCLFIFSDCQKDALNDFITEAPLQTSESLGEVQILSANDFTPFRPNFLEGKHGLSLQEVLKNNAQFYDNATLSDTKVMVLGAHKPAADFGNTISQTTENEELIGVFNLIYWGEAAGQESGSAFSEQRKPFRRAELVSALERGGMGRSDAEERCRKIFNSTICTPTFLAQTAKLVSGVLPPHVPDFYVASLHQPFRTSGFLNNERAANVFYKHLERSQIKEVMHLEGVYGNVVYASGDPLLEITFDEDGDFRFPYNNVSLSVTELRTMLASFLSETQAEDWYRRFLVGDISEEEIWQVFEARILPKLLENSQNSRFLGTAALTKLQFHATYAALRQSQIQMGYTTLNLIGKKKEKHHLSAHADF